MTVLVTGGAGYIGSHAAIELLNSGYNIVIADNFMNSKIESLLRVKELTKKDFKIYNIDLLDRDDLEKVFVEQNIKAVIHFAGLKAVGESVRLPLSYYHNNITSTLILCELMEKYNVAKMVFSSSATVYGTPEQVPITEEFPLSATNPYGQTKLMIEQILKDVAAANPDWSIALLRYFNPIGAHKSGFIGEDPNGVPNNLMPFISQVAIEKLKELTIFGDDYDTVDGTGIRDYIHVVDLAIGHVKALEYVLGHTGVDSYNLGTGQGYSVLQVVNAFEKATGITIPYTISNRRPGDVGICYADPSKSKEILGWEAKKDIYEMCEDTWRWQKNNPNGYVRDVALKMNE